MKHIALLALLALAAPQDAKPWKLAYRDGIQVMEAGEDGKNPTKCPDLAPTYITGEFSPDGKRWVGVIDYGQKIVVMDADGKNENQIADDPSHSPSWSPDGKRIVFLKGPYTDPRVCVMDADGKNVVEVAAPKTRTLRPRFHPDGKRVSWLAQSDPKSKEKWPASNLVIADAGGGKATAVAENLPVYDYAWDPKGERVALGVGGGIEIREIGKKTEPRMLLFGDVNEEMSNQVAQAMLWRPDGAAIACVSVFMGGILGNGKAPAGALFILAVDKKAKSVCIEGGWAPLRWTR